MKRAILIAVGDELLNGLRQEGNCCWLAGKLSKAGWRVDHMEIIPDEHKSLQEALARWVGHSDLLVLSGGLGPTHDDRTRDALASFLCSPLEIDHAAYTAIVSRYPEEMKDLLEKNRSIQGAVPRGARSVHNPEGSALGIAFTHSGTRGFAFPGVPGEFRAMVEQELAEDLLVHDNRMYSLFIVGWPESLLKDRLASVIDRQDLRISILPSFGLIEFVMRGEPSRIAEAEEHVRSLLPDHCLPAGARSLEEAILLEATKKGITIACAESCTGGLVGAALTAIPGSSAIFLGSAVCYSNQAKKNILSVSEALLNQYGAVSSQCAVAMAEGARSVFSADISISVTGIAGPNGGSKEKPVGTVWFATAHSRGAEVQMHPFPGDRTAIRARAATTALVFLWRRVLGAGK